MMNTGIETPFYEEMRQTSKNTGGGRNILPVSSSPCTEQEKYLAIQ